MSDLVDVSTSKQRQGFKPGRSGNPKGRPVGIRHAALMALDAIGTEAGKDILNTVIKAANGGDVHACRILLDRVWPAAKSTWWPSRCRLS